MNMSDDIRRTLSDPKPLYALAGAGDLAAEKLRDAPEKFKDAPARLAGAGAALSDFATRIAADAPERLAKVSATVQDTVGKAARPDTAALRDRAQTVALQQVGRLLEAAGKAVETYDELAERGRVVVGRYTGTAETVPGEPADSGVTVVVEQMSDEELTDSAEQAAATLPEEEPAAPEPRTHEPQTHEPDTAAEAAAVFLEADAQADAQAERPAPKKAARKRASGSGSGSKSARTGRDDAE